jgi:hypothetical protein
MQPWASLGLPDRPSFRRQLPAYLGLNAVQHGNSGYDLGSDRGAIRSIDIDKFTPDMGPASRLLDVPGFIQGIESGIGIGLQRTLE